MLYEKSLIIDSKLLFEETRLDRKKAAIGNKPSLVYPDNGISVIKKNIKRSIW